MISRRKMKKEQTRGKGIEIKFVDRENEIVEEIEKL